MLLILLSLCFIKSITQYNMRQQKQFPISEIKTGRAEKRIFTLNNQSKLSYLLTSRRAGTTKYMKGFRQTQTKLVEQFTPNTEHKKKSVSVFKDSLMTLDDSINNYKERTKKGSQQHSRSNYNTLNHNPQSLSINRKNFVQNHLKTEQIEEDAFRSPSNLECIMTTKFNKSKPLNVFRSKVNRLNTSIHKNSFKEQSPYKTSTLSPDHAKRLKSEPAVRHAPVLVKKKSIDLYGYDYIKELGTGGYARVVLVKKLDQSKPGYYAVKIYDKQKTKQKSKVTNIPRQISIMTSINHPNICSIQDEQENKTTHFIVMQYCGHQSLFRKIGESELGYLSQHQAKRYFLSILESFIYLHNKRIAHRDVKAQNILIHKGEIKLIDFGFSVVPNSTDLVDSYCGTPAYMAPQIFQRSPYNPFKAEIWSLGVLLYLMLQGMYPFITTDETQLIQKIKKGSYKYIKPVSDEARSLIRSMLNVNPSERLPLTKIRSHCWLESDDFD